VQLNAALTAFAAWFGYALRAAEPGSCICRGGHQAFGLPSPAQVSAALGCILQIGPSNIGGSLHIYVVISVAIPAA
jgi:hypothetical protein